MEYKFYQETIDFVYDVALGQKDLFSRPKGELSRIYADFLEYKVMPEIATFSNQRRLLYHGFSHTEQVGLFGIDYALSLNKSPLPVVLAAGIHDAGRMGDGYDPFHAKRGAELAKEYIRMYDFILKEDEKRDIVKAVLSHTTGQEADNYISACLWDADRTRLSWERGYDEKYFNTERAKRVASMDEGEKKAYERLQNIYLKGNSYALRSSKKNDFFSQVNSWSGNSR
ncbi:MAG: hypothetical protein EOM53_00850 [Alphaproteobacteria bacterium]|nr:HD domain-containing protein [Alphaproteobacteria bacterium]NCB49217.1 hypothetical protein [Alphaproteobacteria bacterium]